MTVYEVKGDLLKSDCDFIIHQANCFATMGAGIARQIANRYPEALQADRDYLHPVGSESRLGKFSHAWVNGPYGRQAIINLYGQYRYGRGKQTNEQAFHAALSLILNSIASSKYASAKIGMPKGIGCGLAGGDWDTISTIIHDLSQHYALDIYLYQL